MKEPRATAPDTVVAVAVLGLPCRAICRRVNVLPRAVLDQLPNIAVHVEKPEGIGAIGPDGGGVDVPIPTMGNRPIIVLERRGLVGDIAVGTEFPLAVAEVIACAAPCSRRVLPLRFGQQTIGLAGRFRQPSDEGRRILPAHAHHRMPIVLSKSRIAEGPSGALQPSLPFNGVTFVVDAMIILRREASELPARHLELADCKWSRDAHQTLRAFCDEPARLARRPRHHETARRYHHPLGAIAALPEAVARLQCALLKRS